MPEYSDAALEKMDAFFRGESETPANPDIFPGGGYAGLFFHLFNENGDLHRQGVVKRQIDATHILVAWFSFLDGHENGGEVIEIPKNANWYTGDREMRRAHYEMQVKGVHGQWAAEGWTVERLMKVDDMMAGRQ